MKKKVRFWMYAAAGIVLAAVVTWACWPEYGKGYSEDQRKNWNEMVERVGSDPREFLRSFSGPCALRARQSLSDAPIWKLEMPRETMKLPLEGMSILSLVDLADRGDGDACLELVFRAFNKESGIMSIRAVFQWEKYVKKAVEAGRPGADFLLRLLDEWKKRGKDVYVKDVVGYSAFLSHLDAGDFLLGKVYFYINPKDVSGLDRLASGLERKAEKGDIPALRNRGHLGVLQIAAGGEMNGWSQFYSDQNEYAQKYIGWVFGKITKTCVFLPVSIQPSFWTILNLFEKTNKVVMLWYRKRAMRNLNASLHLLFVAAERGDLHAKFLWTQYSVWGVKLFSRKEWESHLKYVDELMKAGGDYPGNDLTYFWSRDISLVESFFYKNRKEVLLLVDEKRNSECEAFFPGAEKSSKNRSGISSSLKREVEAKCDTASFVEHYMGDVLGQPVEKTKDMMRGLKLMEEAAEEGNPFALYGLARMSNEGILLEPDGRKAWRLLQRLKAWSDGIHKKYLSSNVIMWVTKKGYTTTSSYGTLEDALDHQLLDVVSRHGDMPGMTVEQAFDQFKKKDWRHSEMKAHLKAQFEKLGYKVPEEKNN